MRPKRVGSLATPNADDADALLSGGAGAASLAAHATIQPHRACEPVVSREPRVPQPRGVRWPLLAARVWRELRGASHAGERWLLVHPHLAWRGPCNGAGLVATLRRVQATALRTERSIHFCVSWVLRELRVTAGFVADRTLQMYTCVCRRETWRGSATSTEQATSTACAGSSTVKGTCRMSRSWRWAGTRPKPARRCVPPTRRAAASHCAVWLSPCVSCAIHLGLRSRPAAFRNSTGLAGMCAHPPSRVAPPWAATSCRKAY